MIFVLSSQNQKPKTEPKSSLSDSDSLLQKLHSSAYTTANGDNAKEHQHHLGEHGFHNVAWSEVESLHGSGGAMYRSGCSQEHPDLKKIKKKKFIFKLN